MKTYFKQSYPHLNNFLMSTHINKFYINYGCLDTKLYLPATLFLPNQENKKASTTKGV